MSTNGLFVTDGIETFSVVVKEQTTHSGDTFAYVCEVGGQRCGWAELP